MLITANAAPSVFTAARSATTAARTEKTDSDSVTLSNVTDKVDFSDPKEWIPVAGYGLAGALPVVGTFIHGFQALNSDNTKGERWAAVGATVTSMAGPSLLIHGLTSGSATSIIAGVALTGFSAATFAHHGVKNRLENN